MNSVSLAILIALVAAAALVPDSAAAQIATQVMVYGADSAPYLATGTVDPSGSVIVFDPDLATGVARLTTRRTDAPEAAPHANMPGYLAAPMPALPGRRTVSMYPYGQARPTPALDLDIPAPDNLAQTSRHDAADAAADQSGGEGYVAGTYLIDKNYLWSYPKNLLRMVTGPARFERDDWINVGLVAGIGGGLLLLDETLIENWRDKVHGGTTKTLADLLRPLGDSDNIVLASLGAYTIAELLDGAGGVDTRREKAAALLTLESFLLTQSAITGLKFVNGRERPSGEDTALDFDTIGLADFNASFPSGHAGAAFSAASVLSEIYGPDYPWVPWVANAAATGTALSRVDDNRHWFSDVFVGGAIGLFVGKMVVRYNPFLEANHITLQPFQQERAAGVSLSYHY